MNQDNKFSPWYGLYTALKIIKMPFNQFVLQVDNQFPKDSFFAKQRATIHGIEFNERNMYGFGNLNLYTVLNYLDLFEKFIKNKLGSKRSKNILLSFSNLDQTNSQMFDYCLKYLVANKNQVYTFNFNLANDYLIQSALSNMNADYGFFVDYVPSNNKYYLKIYFDNKLIDFSLMQTMINKLQSNSSQLSFANNAEAIKLNIDKILDASFSGVKTLNNQFISNYNSFIVYSMIDNKLSEHILNRFLTKFNIKHIKLNPKLNQDLVSNSKWRFLSWAWRSNYKADLIILIDINQRLKVIVKSKKGYVTLNEDQLVYLFIHNHYLTWKNDELLTNNQFVIPIDASSLILKLLNIFKINYVYENSLNQSNHILFDYFKGSYSVQKNQNLNFESFDFLFSLILMMQNYKNNNNLFSYKYQKMLKASDRCFLSYKYLKHNPNDLYNLYNHLKEKQRLNKAIKIQSINWIDFSNLGYTYLINIRLKIKYAEVNLFINYDLATKQIELKFETQLLTTKHWKFSDKLHEKLLVIQIKNSINRLIKKLAKQNKGAKNDK
ncbi:MAG5620 family putative phospho-sugar mutase [Mycoplasma nasistruthionis]|uniref:Uncharacterized protein n=1 Tax=Mycoplasma nasistruthionis TaxID=353852 RepID=A0A4Y6I625_9MOLU|nr:hypothetical protein [Mycoplasma nasistruthionis]QDF64802.1 hypothetical protein FIV53_00525 [Mycoplasma nasistruthionis]